MGVGIALGVVGALAAGASAYGASQSASDAQAANKAIAANNNALQWQMFLQSRGAGGSALLPQYPGFTSTGVETNLANQAYATWLAEQQALGTPEQQVAANRALVSQYGPAQAGADQAVNDLFSGAMEQKQIENIAPVAAARGEVAAAQKQGILEGLQARLIALSADRARSGYTGGGSAFQKNVLTSATIPAMQAAGTVGAQADLANAADVAGVKNAAINTRLQNLNLPLAQAGNRIALATLPATAAGTTYTNSMAPLNWFKMSPQANVPIPSPYVTPIPNAATIAGTGVAAGASTLGNYFANQQLANQINYGLYTPTSYSYSANVNKPITQNDAQMIEAYGLSP